MHGEEAPATIVGDSIILPAPDTTASIADSWSDSPLMCPHLWHRFPRRYPTQLPHAKCPNEPPCRPATGCTDKRKIDEMKEKSSDLQCGGRKKLMQWSMMTSIFELIINGYICSQLSQLNASLEHRIKSFISALLQARYMAPPINPRSSLAVLLLPRIG